jgi:putative intracellular protease/amidase
VGFWWSELTHPYYAFHEAGYEVEVFSPAGGKCEADGMSDPRDASGYSASDLISMGFISTPSLAALVEKTKPVSEISVARFDAIVVAGGQAPMFSFERPRTCTRSSSSSTRPARSPARSATAWRSSATRSSRAASCS